MESTLILTVGGTANDEMKSDLALPCAFADKKTRLHNFAFCNYHLATHADPDPTDLPSPVVPRRISCKGSGASETTEILLLRRRGSGKKRQEMGQIDSHRSLCSSGGLLTLAQGICRCKSRSVYHEKSLRTERLSSVRNQLSS